MSDIRCDDAAQNGILVKDYLFGNNKFSLLKNSKDIHKNVKCIPVSKLYKEDVIYASKKGDFLNSEQNIIIANRSNVSSNVCRTIVRLASKSGEVIKSSDEIVNLIGQNNYNVILASLCSIISLEFKVRGILALLTPVKKDGSLIESQSTSVLKTSIKSCQVSVQTSDLATQTDETSMRFIIRQRKKKRVRKQQAVPYVVKDTPTNKNINKIIVKPEEFKMFTDGENMSKNADSYDVSNRLPVLSFNIDEDSNISAGNISLSSLNTIPGLLEDPQSLILKNVEKCTETHEPCNKNANINTKFGNFPTIITLLDGTKVTIPIKPEDDLHIASPDIMQYVMPEHRRKLLLLQAYLDWKYSLQCDEDGNLPLHNAVMANDIDLVRRQCLVFKARQESVDIPVHNTTALQMSLCQPNAAATALLLEFGADPLMTDSENRTCLHLAAEEFSDHLRTILNYCRANPMRILRENEEFWKPQLENKTKEEQAQYLFDRLSRLTDNQGYTLLMLASRIGNYENVKTLVEMSPSSVNIQMPNSGNTALYLAVGAACLDTIDKGNLTKVPDNFLKTIEFLLENGGDPNIDNHSGSNVNVVLTEYNIKDISLVVADALVKKNGFHGETYKCDSPFQKYMLVKDSAGDFNLKELNEVKSEKPEVNTKPKIIENVKVNLKVIKEKEDGKGLPDNKNKINKKNENKFFIQTFRNFIKNNKDAEPEASSRIRLQPLPLKLKKVPQELEKNNSTEASISSSIKFETNVNKVDSKGSTDDSTVKLKRAITVYPSPVQMKRVKSIKKE